MLIMEILSIIIFIALSILSMLTQEECYFTENEKATTIDHNWMTDVNRIGYIGKGLSWVKSINLQKLEGRGGVSKG